MDSIKRKSFNANVDLIHGPIFKSLIIFALPLFISNIFQQLYNTVDTMIVGNFLGDASLAAIGSCTSIYDLLVGFALGIGNGLAIVTARSLSAGILFFSSERSCIIRSISTVVFPLPAAAETIMPLPRSLMALSCSLVHFVSANYLFSFLSVSSSISFSS